MPLREAGDSGAVGMSIVNKIWLYGWSYGRGLSVNLEEIRNGSNFGKFRQNINGPATREDTSTVKGNSPKRCVKGRGFTEVGVVAYFG